MYFTSLQFLWLFPLIFLGYHALRVLLRRHQEADRRVANCVLVLLSYGLYMQWQPLFAWVLLGVTLVTYGFALVVEQQAATPKRRWLVALGVLTSLLPLLVFKYAGFLTLNAQALLRQLGLAVEMHGLNWAIPLGLSFFTFQALGYLVDVCRGRIKAERDLLDYMLFISFFPQLVCGPISKASDLLPQIKSQRAFSYQQAVQGCRALLCGMFLKVVLADNLGLHVDSVYATYAEQSGMSCLLAACCYSFQIYTDFAGYSLMAVGVGKLMGFDLVNNFARPYLAVSITDFWRRWHISLSMWLRDNVYIPMGGSRCSKGRTYWNILVTFLVSGLWHGANWTFVVWGLLHGVAQIVEKALGLQSCGHKAWWVRVGRVCLTFSLVTVAWVFFRMPTLADACRFVTHLFTSTAQGLSYPGKTVLALVLLMVLVEVKREYLPQVHTGRLANSRAVRWTCYLLMLLLMLLYGVYDQGDFIYANF